MTGAQAPEDAPRPPDITVADIVNALWAKLREMRFVLYLLLLLAAVSLMGAVIPQKQPAEAYTRSYGPLWGNLVLALGLDRVFSSPWFLSLAALLMASLVACSRRLWTQARVRARTPTPEAIDREVSAGGEVTTGTVAAGIGQTHRLLRQAARRRGYTVRVITETGTLAHLHLSRNRWAAWGPVLAHYSIFLIGIGAFIGILPGVSVDTQIIVVEGQTNEKGEVPLPFDVRLDAFQIRYDPRSEAVENYYSDLTIIESGREVLHRQVSVNRPLRYRGYLLSQSSYGLAGVRVDVTASGETHQILFPLEPAAQGEDEAHSHGAWQFRQPGAAVFLPGGDTALVAIDFYPNAVRRGKEIVDLGGEHVRTPAIRLVSMSGFKTGQHSPPRDLGVVLVGESVEFPGGTARFVGISQWSGLGVRKDPGVPLVWAGFIGCLLGMMTIFYVRRESVGARLEAAGVQGTRVALVPLIDGGGEGAAGATWRDLLDEVSRSAPPSATTGPQKELP